MNRSRPHPADPWESNAVPQYSPEQVILIVTTTVLAADHSVKHLKTWALAQHGEAVGCYT